jgi:single-strand DNA-binding protein
MSLPTISGTARLLDDPELRFGASGTAVCKMRLAFNSRKRQDDGTWVNDRSFYVTGVLFKQAAENAAEAFTRQTEVVVVGRLCTEEWEDRNGGGKRSAPSLLIDSIGPAVNNYQTAKVSKMERGSSGGAPQGGGSDDPWSTATPASSSRGASSFDDSLDPPF